jgi:segregation and condensation protein B
MSEEEKEEPGTVTAAVTAAEGLEPEIKEEEETVQEESYTPPQSEEELMAAVEAILFAMGDAVEVVDIAKALCQTSGRILDIAKKLEARYEENHSGIMIQRFDNALQMSTRGEQYKNLVRIARVPKKLTLSDSVIETLSIIAYRQPITKAEVEQIRGVSSDYAINKLISYDLVQELGRKDAPGRPLLFGTTEQFLRSFGVKDLSELPSLNTVKTEEFKQEAEQEVDSRLGV